MSRTGHHLNHLVIAAAAALLALPAFAQQSPPMKHRQGDTPQHRAAQHHTGTHSRADARAAASPEHIVSKLSHINQQEMQAGQMAQEKATTEAIRNYGQRLARDHKAANERVQEYARSKNIQVTAYQPITRQERRAYEKKQQAMEQLRTTDGPAFDDAFARAMAEGHSDVISAVSQARQSTRDPELQALLTSLEPVLQQHERQAESLDAQMQPGTQPPGRAPAAVQEREQTPLMPPAEGVYVPEQ